LKAARPAVRFVGERPRLLLACFLIFFANEVNLAFAVVRLFAAHCDELLIWSRRSYINSAVSILALIGLSGLLYVLRDKRRFLYGTVEFSFAISTVWFVLRDATLPKPHQGLTVALGATYVLVRAFDNLAKAKREAEQTLAEVRQTIASWKEMDKKLAEYASTLGEQWQVLVDEKEDMLYRCASVTGHSDPGDLRPTHRGARNFVASGRGR
jgi:hypothetical protein